MNNALFTFNGNIKDIDAITALYNHLSCAMGPAVNLDDLLRSKIVYAVSAFDKLIHDIVTTGMIQIFCGLRPATPKFLSEPIPISLMQNLMSNTATPREVAFEQVVRAKLKTLSFQDPDKVSDGLSYIWLETQKWQKIAAALGTPEKALRTQLRLIAGRRNAIVHEADMDPITNQKLPITPEDTAEIVEMLKKVGTTIHQLINPSPTPKQT